LNKLRWYVDICEKPSDPGSNHFGASLISTKLRITPKLLKLTWLGYPLHFIGDQIIETEKDIKEKTGGYGWGYLVPKDINKIDQQSDDLPFL
jgi:DNA polymerase gamma 1